MAKNKETTPALNLKAEAAISKNTTVVTRYYIEADSIEKMVRVALGLEKEPDHSVSFEWDISGEDHVRGIAVIHKEEYSE